MSSGFVSGGTNEAPIERDDEWLKAQQAIDATRREKAERGKQAEGKSLYEVLQQNKAAKQEAFEESIKLKHQFQALNEDDAEFLESFHESERAKEDAVRKETQEQLEAFRKQREAADSVTRSETTDSAEATRAEGNTSPVQEHQWAGSGKKRRRGPEKELIKGVKLRKVSSSEQTPVANLEELKKSAEAADGVADGTAQAGANEVKPTSDTASGKLPSSSQSKKQASPPAKPTGLGLGAYGSDSD